MKKPFNVSAKLKSEKGVTLVYVALLLVVFLGMAALAVDIGYVMVSKNELQDAADAAALAGASFLYPQISAPSPSPPAWGTATTQANNAIGLNKSSGTALTDGTVQTGYWNLAHTPYGLQGTGITPGPQDCAAVQVAVSRSAGHNSGPVQHWFAPVIGINTSDVSAVATAAMCSPSTALPGALLPLVINKALADRMQYHDQPGTKFKITNEQKTDGINGSYWTTFFERSNCNSCVKNVLDGSVKSPQVSVGDNIQIDPGVRNVDYALTDQYWSNKTVTLPVVQTLDGNTQQPIVGFVCFHIQYVYVQGSHSYIEGYFVPGCYAGGTNGNGQNYGAYAPPRLVQ